MLNSLMIVDDSATMRKIISRVVEMSGLVFGRMEEASSGTEALEKLQAAPVDVVLCDINMPEMSGSELVRRVREELPKCNGTKIIMVSAESCQDRIENLMAAGADGYITKPFTPEKFQQELAKFVTV